MQWSRFNFLFRSSRLCKYLLYNTYTNCLLAFDDEGYDELCNIINNPDSILNNGREYKFLLDGRFIVESNEQELYKVIYEGILHQYHSRSINLTLAPTSACNFACRYCYEGEKRMETMSSQTQDSIIKYIKNANEKSLFVTWYGGEPTLSPQIICNLTERMVEIVPYYSAMMITNGYLLGPLVPKLESLNIRLIQITLDGTEKAHNHSRYLHNGCGTFNRIIENIHLILNKTSKVRVSIRMNIDKGNQSQYIELYNYIVEEFHDKRISIYPAFIHPPLDWCSSLDCFIDGQEKAAFLTELYDKYGLYSNHLQIRRQHKGCMMQNSDSFVIGPNGEIYKCWHHLGQDKYAVGNINDNPIFSFGKLADYSIFENPIFINECKKCVLFPSCDGGCADLKSQGYDCCTPAKVALEHYLELRYNYITALKNRHHTDTQAVTTSR